MHFFSRFYHLICALSEIILNCFDWPCLNKLLNPLLPTEILNHFVNMLQLNESIFLFGLLYRYVKGFHKLRDVFFVSLRVYIHIWVMHFLDCYSNTIFSTFSITWRRRGVLLALDSPVRRSISPNPVFTFAFTSFHIYLEKLISIGERSCVSWRCNPWVAKTALSLLFCKFYSSSWFIVFFTIKAEVVVLVWWCWAISLAWTIWYLAYMRWFFLYMRFFIVASVAKNDFQCLIFKLRAI
mgnify:CR=1 FL=1